MGYYNLTHLGGKCRNTASHTIGWLSLANLSGTSLAKLIIYWVNIIYVRSLIVSNQLKLNQTSIFHLNCVLCLRGGQLALLDRIDPVQIPPTWVTSCLLSVHDWIKLVLDSGFLLLYILS